MNFVRLIAAVFALPLLVSTVSCQNKDSNDGKTELNFSHVFEGSFQHQYPMRMELKSEDGKLTGQYYMAGTPGDRKVEGTLEADGSFSLRDIHEKGNDIGAFAGKMYDNYFVTGIYKSFNAEGELLFHMTKSDKGYDEWKGGMQSANAANILFGQDRNIQGSPSDEVDDDWSTIEWKTLKHDFGEIVQGEKVKHVFSFKNVGDKPVKIKSVNPSCGCTTPDWTRKEIEPGENGIVTVVFDSHARSGLQKKSVSVFTNTRPAQTTLSFEAVVKVP